MSKREFKAIRFEGTDDKAFGIDVRKRVDEYFKTNNISRHGDYRSWIKVALLPLLYITTSKQNLQLLTVKSFNTPKSCLCPIKKEGLGNSPIF